MHDEIGHMVPPRYYNIWSVNERAVHILLECILVANFVFSYICSFRHFVHHMMTVNVKLEIADCKRIIFHGCKLHWHSKFLVVKLATLAYLHCKKIVKNSNSNDLITIFSTQHFIIQSRGRQEHIPFSSLIFWEIIDPPLKITAVYLRMFKLLGIILCTKK